MFVVPREVLEDQSGHSPMEDHNGVIPAHRGPYKGLHNGEGTLHHLPPEGTTQRSYRPRQEYPVGQICVRAGRAAGERTGVCRDGLMPREHSGSQMNPSIGHVGPQGSRAYCHICGEEDGEEALSVTPSLTTSGAQLMGGLMCAGCARWVCTQCAEDLILVDPNEPTSYSCPFCGGDMQSVKDARLQHPLCGGDIQSSKDPRIQRPLCLGGMQSNKVLGIEQMFVRSEMQPDKDS